MRKLEGFTLIEVIIALTILSIAMMALLKGNIFNLRSSKEASDLTIAVIAADSIIKDEIGKKGLKSGVYNGAFEDEIFKGLKWEKRIETLNLPLTKELKLITVEVKWKKNKSYKLQTILSEY